MFELGIHKHESKIISCHVVDRHFDIHVTRAFFALTTPTLIINCDRISGNVPNNAYNYSALSAVLSVHVTVF